MIAVVRRAAVAEEDSKLVEVLRGSGWTTQSWSPAEAESDAGFPVGAQVVVFETAPGTAPLLESEAYQEATVMYAHVDGAVGTVGPVTAAGSAPCPTCLASVASDDAPEDVVTGWVASSVVMELETLHRLGVGTLFGTSLTWSLLDEPGLSSASHHRRDGCTTSGCTQP